MLNKEELQTIIDKIPKKELAETIYDAQKAKWVLTDLAPLLAIVIIVVLYLIFG